MTMLPSPRARLHRWLADDAARRTPLPPVAVAPVAAGSASIARRRISPAPDSGPLALTDEQLTAVMHAAEPLAVGDRDAFLRDVAAALRGRQLGDGMVYRTIAQVQRHYDPPVLTAGPWHPGVDA